jgi:cytosine/adenosine deaminase-related metal-dependent hydrolase
VTARADDAYTAPIDEDGGFHLNDELRRWAHRDGYADLVDIDYATTQFVSHYRSTGQNRHNWPEAWRKWIREDHKRAAERASRSHLRALPSAGIDGLVSRQQQETDDWSARAMNRAINRMQQTGTDPLELPS